MTLTHKATEVDYYCRLTDLTKMGEAIDALAEHGWRGGLLPNRDPETNAWVVEFNRDRIYASGPELTERARIAHDWVVLDHGRLLVLTDAEVAARFDEE